MASLVLNIPYVLGLLQVTDLLGPLGQIIASMGIFPVLFAAVTGLWLVIPAVPFLGCLSAFMLGLLNKENKRHKYDLFAVSFLLLIDSIWLLVSFWPPIGSPLSVYLNLVQNSGSVLPTERDLSKEG